MGERGARKPIASGPQVGRRVAGGGDGVGWGGHLKQPSRFVKVHWISVGGLIKGREREGEEGETEGREEGK